MRRLLRTCLIGACTAALAGLMLGITPTASGDPPCGLVEYLCSKKVSGQYARATNEMEKFKWDFKRELEDLGEMASQDEVDELVERYCNKIEVRGEFYSYRIGVITAICRNQLRDCECNGAERDYSCQTGYRRNVVRRAYSYYALIHSSVYECCEEIRAMADDMMSP